MMGEPRRKDQEKKGEGNGKERGGKGKERERKGEETGQKWGGMGEGKGKEREKQGKERERYGEERGPNRQQPASSGGCSGGKPPTARHKLKGANRQQL